MLRSLIAYLAITIALGALGALGADLASAASTAVRTAAVVIA